MFADDFFLLSAPACKWQLEFKIEMPLVQWQQTRRNSLLGYVLIFEIVFQHLKYVILEFISGDAWHIASIFVFQSGDLILSLIYILVLVIILKNAFEIMDVCLGKKYERESSNKSDESKRWRVSKWLKCIRNIVFMGLTTVLCES